MCLQTKWKRAGRKTFFKLWKIKQKKKAKGKKKTTKRSKATSAKRGKHTNTRNTQGNKKKVL